MESEIGIGTTFKRKQEVEGCPYSYFTFHGYFPMVGIDHIFDNFRSQTGATFFSAHGMYRKQAIPHFGGHAASGVLYLKNDSISL